MRTTQSGESALLLLDVVDALEARDIRYAVIGAMAASVHGIVRASMDADALISIPSHELAEIERSFRRAGFSTELRFGESGDPIAAVLELNDGFGNRVDLLVGLQGLDPGAFARTLEVPFYGSKLRVVGREDFIAMKLFAGGPQDISDARYALAGAGEQLDLGLLRRLASGFGRSTAAALSKLLADTSR